MKLSLLTLLVSLIFPLGPLFSHGYSENCSEECNDYYCPPEHLGNKKEKVKKKIPLKE